MEYCIVYLSSLIGLLSDEDLARILRQSQKNNRTSGITGVLFYFNGCIIQVLEGSETRVKGLYEVICRDPLHSQVTQFYSYPIEHRSFSDWFMGYKTISANELNHLKDKLLLLDKPFSLVSKEDSAIRSLVQVFYENNYQT